MRLSSALAAFAVLPVLGACSIHPLQQDVTGKKTTEIVDHIRCEARMAIEAKVISLLQHYSMRLRESNDDERADKATQLADMLEENPDLFSSKNIIKHLNDKEEKDFYKKYIDAAMALDFTFEISEENREDTQIDVIKPLTRGMFSIGLSDSGDLKRMDTRRFLITNTFGELLDNDKFKCKNFSAALNIEYPISGSIGMRELIDTFVDLNREQPLQIVEDKVFADTLLFTTTLTSSISPKIGMPAAGRNLQIMDASITATGTRIDGHKLIIGLSFPVKNSAAAAPTRTTIPILNGFPGSARIGERPARTATERAIQATEQQRVNTFYDSFSGLGLR